MFVSRIASGNLVEAHIMVSRYWLPALVHDNGPTQSTVTLLNSSSTAGLASAVQLVYPDLVSQ